MKCFGRFVMMYSILRQRKEELDSMIKRKGTVLILLGILMIAAAMCLTAYNIWDGKRAEQASNEISEVLIAKISEDDSQSGLQVPMFDPATPMPVEVIDGYEYIGVLEIPSLNLSLPVMNEWDYTRLKISPCRFTGSYYADDLVICAHNYATHFSPIKWIEIGADVYLTNVEGMSIHYIVTNRETVEPTAVEQMIENTNNSETSTLEWDLTLFTCNTGGQTRCAVRCKRMEVSDESMG